jgi:glycine dehydrogenase subunit 1
MRYLPHTEEDILSMLQVAGVESLDELFSSVPADCRRESHIQVPGPVTEWELNNLMENLSRAMGSPPKYKVFLGAGSYEHFIPAAVTYLLSRSEFVTSYTPYQPEMSQGTLQGIFEYQTLVSRLLGMEVANASLYDGASALAEALFMAIRITGGRKVAVSRLIHPLYRQVVRTYFDPTGFVVEELPYLEDGRTDLAGLKEMKGLAAVAVQSPNFFGCVEDLQTISERLHERNVLLLTCFTEPLSYGLFNSPGSQGADIACGEGQSFGIPSSFGGPGLGMFASKMKFVRNMPGRLVGQTTDLEGRRGYVLTLATREQHIRREKATSNICTNNSLCALAAAMYMSSLGGTGIRELALLNRDKAEYLKLRMKEAGFQVPFASPTFNEFVVEMPQGFDRVHSRLLEKKLLAGLNLAPYYPELPSHYLFCVTETKDRNDMDTLMEELRSC